MKKIFEKYNKVFFSLVALLLLYPTFQEGYIFFLDGQVLPHITLSDINFQTDSIVRIAYYLLSIVFSFGVFQRIYLFAIIFFLGLTGFRLAKKTGSLYAQYFTGLFFIFNPFIYARLLEQSGIALGSMFFFWFLIYFLEYLEEKRKSYKKLIIASIFAGLSVATFVHSIFFIIAAVAILLVFDFIKNKGWKEILKSASIISSVVLIINANWIIAFLKGISFRISGIKSFSADDWRVFQTVDIGGHSVYATVLALQGYWGEYQDRFVSIQDNPIWSLGFILILSLAIFGAFKIWKNNQFAKPLAILFLVAFVLAIGVASPIFKPMTVFLFTHVPFYIGLREPQKWVAVMVFIYAFFAGWGIKYLLEIKKIKEYGREIGIFCVILPLIFSFSMISGTHKSFAPHSFPGEWKEAKNYLYKNPDSEKILFFPWHSYLKLDFAGKNITNPARGYFGKNIIWGNNTEFGGMYSHSFDEQTLAIERYVIRKDNPAENINYANFSADMKKLGIKMIMLAKAEDWQDYLWLDRIGSDKVLENDKIIIYSIK